MDTLKVGMRVALARDVDRFPDFIARKGSTGTIVGTDTREGILVRMDETLPGANEWGNCIAWYAEHMNDLPGDLVEAPPVVLPPLWRRDLDF